MSVKCQRINVHCTECDWENYYRNFDEFIKFGGEGAECPSCGHADEVHHD